MSGFQMESNRRLSKIARRMLAAIGVRRLSVMAPYVALQSAAKVFCASSVFSFDWKG